MHNQLQADIPKTKEYKPTGMIIMGMCNIEIIY
jgi:hypothetical protein